MEDHFRSVKTWRGYVMVSSCLLPPSNAEKSRIYPDQAVTSSDIANATAAVQETKPENGQRPPVPDYWHHERSQDLSPAMDFQYDISPLYTPNSSHLAVPSDYFLQTEDPNAPPTVEDETVRSPDSLHVPVPAWLQNSQDWEYTSRISSEEPASSNSPAIYSTDTCSAPVTPYYSSEHPTGQARLGPSPVPPADHRLSLPDPPRLELPPRRKWANGEMDGANGIGVGELAA